MRSRSYWCVDAQHPLPEQGQGDGWVVFTL